MFDTTLADEPADGWPDITLDWPIAMAEGFGPTGEALNLLAGVDPWVLSEESRASALAQLAAIDAHLQSVRARYTDAVAGSKPDDPSEDWGAHEVAVASRCSVYAADQQIRFARDLAERLTATFEALEAGRISYPQARVLSEATMHLKDEIAWQIEDRMLRYAWRQDLTKFKTCLRRWLARLDPQFADKTKEAREEIQVVHTAFEDGTGEVYVRGPLEKTAVIDTALRAYAKATKTAKGGTTEARKLDALVDWAETSLTSPQAPKRHGRPFSVPVIIDAPTMFGLANHPAEIPGYGLVPAEAALELLADGTPIRRLIIDEHDGRLLHYGTKTYLVPPPLADHLIALHQTSIGPHSTTRAELCDMEHNIPHQQGGTTDPGNNAPADRRWHRAKTHAGWTYVKNKDASVTWTSPNGLTETVYPHDYRLGP